LGPGLQAAIFVKAVGMACPVGLSWATACAAMRAGITRRRFSSLRDNEGEEIVTSHLQIEPLQGALRAARCRLLLDAALADLARQVNAEELRRCPLFLAMTPALAPPDGSEASLPTLSAVLGSQPGPIRQIEGPGAFAALAALREVRARLEDGESCILAAADSMVGAREIQRLAQAGRLLSPINSDGVTPGEAAVVLLFTRDASGALAKVCGLGFGDEPSSLDNDVPLRADGLVGATRLALDDARMALADIDFRVSDAAGESFFFKEQALLVSRLLHDRRAAFPLWLPARSLGDTGTAAASCGLAWAMAAWARGYAPGPRAIGFAGNERGQRAAVILETVR